MKTRGVILSGAAMAAAMLSASNYARRTLPDLRKHLQLAEALERNPRG